MPKPLFDAFVASTLDSALVSSGRLLSALLKVVLSSWSEPSVCSWMPSELRVENAEEAPRHLRDQRVHLVLDAVAVLSPCRVAAVLVVGS